MHTLVKSVIININSFRFRHPCVLPSYVMVNGILFYMYKSFCHAGDVVRRTCWGDLIVFTWWAAAPCRDDERQRRCQCWRHVASDRNYVASTPRSSISSDWPDTWQRTVQSQVLVRARWALPQGAAISVSVDLNQQAPMTARKLP